MNTINSTYAGRPGNRPRCAGWFFLTVSRLERLADDTVAVTLHVPTDLATVFAVAPGQHVTIRHRHSSGDELRRTYSLCPPPFDSGALRLVIRRRSPDGFGAYALSSLSVGDHLELAPPAGAFGLPEVRSAHHLMIAGGTGITPLAAMAAAALRDVPDCRVSIIHVVRTAAQALLADELAALKDAFMDRFTVLYVLSREQRESGPLTGRIDAKKFLTLLNVLDARPHDTTFSLCGPWGLMEVVLWALTAWGARPDRVRAELFWASARPLGSGAQAAAAVRPARQFRAVIGGRSTLVPMESHDRVLLDALLRARPEAPYACRNGVCGSCRAKVTSGHVTLGPQHALDAHDIAAGYTLACCAWPSTDNLTLDFDV
ncbi:2Fe-2S iron-sulfur cluster-binding protein [Streptomyces sp. NPDC020800]|uniref:2Fe-2S iron-sulfur cluster-binding protein n=1 Tax=Streptomyces sp. NPDC020800 TaxID=3365092 RepID=UPI00378B201D